METVTPGFPSSCWEWEGRWCCSGCVCGLTCSCLWSNAMGQGDGNGAGGVLLAWVSHTGGGCGLLALCPGGEGDSGTMPVPPCPSGEVSATPRVTNPTSSLCPASEEPPKGAEMAYIPAPPQGFAFISPSWSYTGTSLHPHPCAIWAQHPHPCPKTAGWGQGDSRPTAQVTAEDVCIRQVPGSGTQGSPHPSCLHLHSPCAD